MLRPGEIMNEQQNKITLVIPKGTSAHYSNPVARDMNGKTVQVEIREETDEEIEQKQLQELRRQSTPYKSYEELHSEAYDLLKEYAYARGKADNPVHFQQLLDELGWDRRVKEITK